MLNSLLHNKKLLSKILISILITGVIFIIFLEAFYLNHKKDLSEIIITMSEQGFSPRKVKISVGQKVTWINEESSERWPAADLHPTHSLYPGSSIRKCGTEEQVQIFDACKPIKKAETYSFIFTNPGKWEYHDHLKPQFLGTITVKKD